MQRPSQPKPQRPNQPDRQNKPEPEPPKIPKPRKPVIINIHRPPIRIKERRNELIRHILRNNDVDVHPSFVM